MNIKDLASGRRDLFMLDPSILVMQPGFNLREEGPELDEYIEALALYTKDNGVPGILTITMINEKPVVMDGHCRTRGAMIAIKKYGAEIKSVPCRMMDKYANEVDQIAQLITSNSGRQLTPIEKAGVVKRLRAFNLENKEIAVKLGMPEASVVQLLELCAAPLEVVNMVKRGEASVTTVVREVKKSPEKAKERLQEGLKKARAAGKKKVTNKYMDVAPKKSMTVEAIKKAIDMLDMDDQTEILHYVRRKL